MADNDPLDGLPAPAQAQAIFSNPAFLKEMALTAAQNRDPAMFKWLEQAHTAAKEGAFEAVGHLMAGNPQEAMAVWNRTGQLRDVVNVNQNKDGTYSINRKDGSTVTIDPVKEYKRFLSPREFIASQQHEKEMQDRATERQLTRDQWNRQFQQTQDWQKAQIERWDLDRADRNAIAAGNAALRVAGVGGGSRGTGSRSSGSGGGGSGGDGFNKDSVKSYADFRKEVLEMDKAAREGNNEPPPPITDEEVSRRAAIRQVQATAQLDIDPKSKNYVIRARLPSGQLGVIATFTHEGHANEAVQTLQMTGQLPKSNYIVPEAPGMERQVWEAKGRPGVNLRAMENAMPEITADEARAAAKKGAAPAPEEKPKRRSSYDRLDTWTLEQIGVPLATGKLPRGPEAYSTGVPAEQQFGAMGSGDYWRLRRALPENK